ncbi:MAG: hypothetical protein RR830_04250 [Enterococcus sp.]
MVKIEQVVGGFEKITEKYRGSSTIPRHQNSEKEGKICANE